MRHIVNSGVAVSLYGCTGVGRNNLTPTKYAGNGNKFSGIARLCHPNVVYILIEKRQTCMCYISQDDG